ncbi:hypothetical protein DAPPUDRAFT_239471 [Daphnia pulex]|uniref:Uncharacterized protein n=1 Tax=Daphnia pulex TaxID=6669 RepID=E9G9F5_DAPPU|nr:hypothetical protein DAPPUDRAFT_239471 [Daphnia pulex]|eukprot:EFX83883.1 hypothetical protein DAPPUDRAFT_239471 [Daphnia pulex]
MFNFLTGKSAIVKGVANDRGFKTTVTVPGDPFVAEYFSHSNNVKENKRQCATKFLNHLIEMGVVTLDGHRGENFNAYVVSLNAKSWENFIVHNARTKVEHALGILILKKNIESKWTPYIAVMNGWSVSSKQLVKATKIVE